MKILTFYKLNDEEKNNLREETPLEKELKMRNIELESQIKILKAQKRFVEEKAENFKSQVELNKIEIENLKKENETLQCEKSRNDVNISGLKSRIDKMKNKIEELERENETLQCEKNRNDVNISGLKSHIDKMKNKIEELERENETLQCEKSRNDVNISGLKSRIDKIKNENEKFEKEIETLKYKLSQSETNNISLRVQIEQKKNEIERLSLSANNQIFHKEKTSYAVGDKINLGGYSWTVIETEQTKNLLLCDEIVDTNTLRNGSYAPANWKNSAVRKWLNGEFFNRFSNSEKQRIISATHDDLKDDIFLLSRSEFMKTRENIFNINQEWWLRPSGAVFIEYDAVGNSLNLQKRKNASEKKAIRPALYIKNN